MPYSQPQKVRLGRAATAVWCAVSALGLILLIRYRQTPAASAADVGPHSARTVIPAEFRGPRPTLVMVIHPHCPCSRASLHELRELLQRTQTPLNARVVFSVPPDAPADWVGGELWELAKSIPGLATTVDADNRLVRSLGATTSGQVFLFDKDGTLLFDGGITDGRGHEGDNRGLTAALARVDGRTADFTVSPVFGCPLQSPQSTCSLEPNR